MSYYRPSFSQTVAMTRGSSRGYSSSRGSSYRGGGSRGSSWNDTRGGRGSFSSSRGGGRFSSSSSWGNTGGSNSFDSRSRYSSSAGGGERYSSSSRGRPDESSYRRSSYRSDGPNSSYSSSREPSTRSPDRKRMRAEAPSSRRSHDGGYGGGGDGGYGGGNASRYESSQGGGGGGGGYNSERRSFADERRPTFRSPRDEFRKPGGPPPSSTAARSPRGSGGYRGRLSSRGARGSRLQLRDGIVRRRITDSRSFIRKRGATLRSTSDYLRALRISRIRSAARRPVKKPKVSDKEDSEKEEENWDDEINEEEKKKEKEKEASPAIKVEEEAEKKAPPKKSPKKEKEKDESDKEEEKKSESGDEDRPRSKYTGRPFIRLTCIHCNMKCVTFREYSVHLYSGRHIAAMRKIALKQKAVLARMRAQQRQAQRELEKNDDSLGSRTIFCPLCKLNYRQQKSVHQMSDAHRNMKKFLMPYCRTCYITFKSPMLYENHMCSLDHIRRKAKGETVNGEKHGSEKDPGSPVEEDLENFMTLDSVGDVDEEDEDGNKIAKSPTTTTAPDGEAPKSKEPINVGAEHVKKVSVYYCDLCRLYLSRHDDDERAMNVHCAGRMHLQRYVRYKKDKDLRRQAERIHRKSQEAKEAKEKEKEKEKEKDKDTKKTEKPDVEVKVEVEKQEAEPAAAEEEAGDDKMWADVDKDLGEILAEAEAETGNKSSDEDEDSRPDGERYDRFKLSEKGGDEKVDPKVNKKEAEVEKVAEDEEKTEDVQEEPSDDK